MKRKAKSSLNRLDLQQGMSLILNPFIAKPDSKKRCRGCELRSADEYCKYRYWAKESSKGYRFRLYSQYGGFTHTQLPICKNPEFCNKTKPLKPTIWDKIKTTEL